MFAFNSMLGFIVLLLVASFAQILGGAISWLFVKEFHKRLRLIILAEVSLMLFVAIVLIYEGLKVTNLVLLSLLAGIGIMCVLDKIICHKHKHDAKEISLLVLIAMCFHEFPEGIAFGTAFLINPALGLLTAALIALHNIPEGSVITIPYFIKGKLANGLKAVSLTQGLYIAGSLLAFFLLVNVPYQIQAMAMSFAAGAMLFIVAEECLMVKN